jgi:hypothetical protein
VKQQVENALNVTAKEFGRTEKERLVKDRFKGISVEIAVTGSGNRQFYQ